MESGALIWICGSCIRPAPIQLAIDMEVEIQYNGEIQYNDNKYCRRRGQVTRFNIDDCWVQLYAKENNKVPTFGIVNCEDDTKKRYPLCLTLMTNVSSAFSRYFLRISVI